MTLRYGLTVHSLELARGLSGRRRLLPAVGFSEKELEDQKKAPVVVQAAVAAPAATAAVLPSPKGGDYLDDLRDALVELQGSELALTDVPKLIAVADGADEFVPGDEAGTPRMRVDEVSVSGRRISVVVEYGHLGWSHRALGAQRTDDAELDGKSPAERFRLEFLVPPKGERGIVVSEVIARANALPMLNAWINHVLRGRDGDENFPRLMTPQLTDTTRVQRLLRPEAVNEIELKKPAGDGVPTGATITVKEKFAEGHAAKEVVDLISQWVEMKRGKQKYTEDERLEQVQALAELVDENIAKAGFDDGVVKLSDGEGRPVSVSPGRLGEMFIVRIANSRPGASTWENTARQHAERMAELQEAAVEW
jgi:hypothetical protein